MKKTLEEKLQMCKEHVDKGKTISHVCELHGTVDKDDFKYYNETRIVTRLKTNPVDFRNKCLNEL